MLFRSWVFTIRLETRNAGERQAQKTGEMQRKSPRHAAPAAAEVAVKKAVLVEQHHEFAHLPVSGPSGAKGAGRAQNLVVQSSARQMGLVEAANGLRGTHVYPTQFFLGQVLASLCVERLYCLLSISISTRSAIKCLSINKLLEFSSHKLKSGSSLFHVGRAKERPAPKR